ncbi:MAG: 50S ribosomal protein L9 [Chloroflexi bacterium]|nr:MAG: 50S ribosomal protein L9 [Chloroflexota bacterium]
MKILLLKDVERLGRAGEIKEVADGYARNYLIPQGFALRMTPGVAKQVEVLRRRAVERQARETAELTALAEQIQTLTLTFAVKASEETGRLYGSVTTGHIAEALERELGRPFDRRKIGGEPLRRLGTYRIPVRLSPDLVPEVTVIVHREGEPPVATEAGAEAEAEAEAEPTAGEMEVATEAAEEASPTDISPTHEVTEAEQEPATEA